MIEKTIEEVMSEMIKILEEEDDAESYWKDVLKSLLHRKKTIDPREFDYQVKEMYGGMGSLSDLVLYKDGKLMVEASTEFDNLRHTLFELVISHHYK